MVYQDMVEYISGMSLVTAELPADMVSLRAFALACQSKAVQRWQPAWTESDLQQCLTKVR